ncbi:hypothetical protein B0H14DRAFT_3763612 [Mycena olivaceomarginata]|nr:hypothetical protein B0H14DRAFT_3763612 [Mycena olivaceomarginata]
MASSDTPKITLLWLEKSRAQRILWLLEELGVPYEIKAYKRDPKTQCAALELKVVHLLGKSPVVTIGDFAIAESALIRVLERALRSLLDSDQVEAQRRSK